MTRLAVHWRPQGAFQSFLIDKVSRVKNGLWRHGMDVFFMLTQRNPGAVDFSLQQAGGSAGGLANEKMIFEIVPSICFVLNHHDALRYLGLFRLS